MYNTEQPKHGRVLELPLMLIADVLMLTAFIMTGRMAQVYTAIAAPFSLKPTRIVKYYVAVSLNYQATI